MHNRSLETGIYRTLLWPSLRCGLRSDRVLKNLCNSSWHLCIMCILTIRAEEVCNLSCFGHLLIWNWNRREGGRAPPLKEWLSCWGHDINWLESTRSKMVGDSTFSGPWASLYAHCNTIAKWLTHRCHDSSEGNHKRPKSRRRQWSNSWKFPHFSRNSWNNSPTH